MSYIVEEEAANKLCHQRGSGKQVTLSKRKQQTSHVVKEEAENELHCWRGSGKQIALCCGRSNNGKQVKFHCARIGSCKWVTWKESKLKTGKWSLSLIHSTKLLLGEEVKVGDDSTLIEKKANLSVWILLGIYFRFPQSHNSLDLYAHLDPLKVHMSSWL